jgi:hypothetical protein
MPHAPVGAKKEIIIIIIIMCHIGCVGYYASELGGGIYIYT